MKLTPAEARTAYECALPKMREAYAKSGDATAKSYVSWRKYNSVAYVSATHGERFVNNYANARASAYGKFEKSGKMPVGSVLAKDSFVVSPQGQVSVGPLFLMEKMGNGFNRESGNWKYTMVTPDGSVFGITKVKNDAGVKFCAECHAAVGDNQDHMFFLPTEFRAK